MIITPSNDTDYNGFLHKNPRFKIKCEANSSVSSGYPCESAIYNAPTRYYCSARDDFHQWISFEFKNYLIAITNYSLSAPYVCCVGPKSWTVEGFDGSKWYLIDNVTDYFVLNKCNKTVTRPAQTIGIFSKIKLTQTDLNIMNENELRISNFDVFGSIRSKSAPTCYQTRKNHLKTYFIIYILTIS